jgi:hypothetical protein
MRDPSPCGFQIPPDATARAQQTGMVRTATSVGGCWRGEVVTGSLHDEVSQVTLLCCMCIAAWPITRKPTATTVVACIGAHRTHETDGDKRCTSRSLTSFSAAGLSFGSPSIAAIPPKVQNGVLALHDVILYKLQTPQLSSVGSSNLLSATGTCTNCCTKSLASLA